MKKRKLFGMIIVLTLVLLFLNISIVQASTFSVGSKTITFEKFSPEGIDEEVVNVYDYKNNLEGIIFETESNKIYHMDLDGTIEEITEEEQNTLYNTGELIEDYIVYCGYSEEEPAEFSQNLPEITFVEGTDENAGNYAVKFGDTIVSNYDYSETFGIATDEMFDIGNVMMAAAKNKVTNKIDIWINTKTESKVVAVDEEGFVFPSGDKCEVLLVYTYNEQGNEQLIVFDWSGNELVSTEVVGLSYADVYKINTYKQDFLQIDFYYSNGENKSEIYDLQGNKVLETENDSWLYAFQFGMLEYHSEEANTSKVIDIKTNKTISDVIETNWLDLYATTAKLKKTSEDYLAPGKYFFVTNENETYVMTISYTILEGAESSINKNSENNLIIKVDGDLEKIEGIYVKDEKIDEINYTLTEGSTIVALKNEYLKTLEVGEYALKVKYLDGEVETKFIVTEEIKEEENIDPTPMPDDGNEGEPNKGEDDKGTNNPDDNTMAPEKLPAAGKITIGIVTLIFSVVGFISFIKSKKYKEI